MASKEDEVTTRIRVAYNELSKRGALEKLPEDMQGAAIPDAVQNHEGALTGKVGAKSAESGSRESAGDVREETRSLLTRVRHGVLSGYKDQDDPRIAAYGKLGIGDSHEENRQRLENLAETTRAPLEAGEIALVADLQPDALAAHAKKHKEHDTGKVAAIAKRQTGSTSLKQVRKDSAKLLQRIKNFVKAFYGPEQLEAFGFGVPAPPSRPRMRGIEEEAPAE